MTTDGPMLFLTPNCPDCAGLRQEFDLSALKAAGLTVYTLTDGPESAEGWSWADWYEVVKMPALAGMGPVIDEMAAIRKALQAMIINAVIPEKGGG